MTLHDDDRPTTGDGDQLAVIRRPRARRRQAVVGAVGLAAVLGVGAWAMTAQQSDGTQTTTTDAGALATIAPALSTEPVDSAELPPSPPASAAGSASARSSASGTATGSAVPTRTPADQKKVRKEVEAARSAAAKDGHPLQRALTPRAGVASVETVTRTEKTAEGTVRITTAKGDLTGQREQLMAADAGLPAGRARCTQKIRISASAAPREIPTLLLCWRTSVARSVVTFAVVKKGKPAMAASAALIDREWAKLG